MAGGHSGSWPGFFRVFAVFAALMLLLSQGAQELVSPSSGAWQVLSIYEGLTRWSMPALFLLWGMSALEGGGRGGLSGALLGRALPAFCMLVFWGAVYAAAAHLLGDGALSWSGLCSALLSAARGNTYFHLWPLYPLVGLYLIQPLLARFTASASRSEALYLLGLSFLAASLLPLWAAFHPNHALVVLLDRFQIHAVLGWVGYYLAGWYLHHYVIGRIPEFLIYLLGILGVVLTLAGPRLIGGGRELWYSYTAPGVACTAVALCVLFRYVLGVSEERSRRRSVYSLGSFAFGIYLIHQLWVLVFRWLGVSMTAFSPVLAVPFFALVFFLLSAPFAWLLFKIPGVGKYLIE